MARKLKGEVKLSEVHFDEDLYPRSKYNWQTAYDYSQSMRTGSVFPPIVLALLNGKKYLVDGKHRIEARKLLKKDKVEAIVFTGWNKKKIFLEAIKANITHGRCLSPYEKRRIAVKLMEMNLKGNEISELIQIPEDKLERFISTRLVNAITGEEIIPGENENIAREIGQAILKSGIKHFAGRKFTEEEMSNLEVSQKDYYMGSQVTLLTQLIKMLENNQIDKKNKEVVKLLKKLKSLLKKF